MLPTENDFGSWELKIDYLRFVRQFVNVVGLTGDKLCLLCSDFPYCFDDSFGVASLSHGFLDQKVRGVAGFSDQTAWLERSLLGFGFDSLVHSDGCVSFLPRIRIAIALPFRWGV
jgi:hypothetical protein